MSSTSSSSGSTVLNKKFRRKLDQILSNWQQGNLTAADIRCLNGVNLTMEEYLTTTDEFHLGHGVELVKNHIHLNEYTTAVHEILGGAFDDWVTNVYSTMYLRKLRSTSTYPKYLSSNL